MKTEYIYKAKITNVVDGDTVDAMIDLGFGIFIDLRLRLYGIDTPEMNSKILEERLAAQDAKKFVATMCLNQDVLLKTYKKDKYGRYLADINIGDATVNQLLLAEGLAKVY